MMKNEIWLDVGNSIGKGCFDYHQDEGYQSTFSVLMHNLNYLHDLKESARLQNTVFVHMHEDPNPDCVVSYYAVQYYLEHEEPELFNFFGNNGKGWVFEKYINDIDAGRNKVASYPTLYAIFCMIGTFLKKSEERNILIVERGLKLISSAHSLLLSEDVDISRYDFRNLLEEDFAYEISLIDNSAQAYEEDKRNYIVNFEMISLWTKDGINNVVPAAIWKDMSSSYNGYQYAREEGAVVTVVPYSIKGKHGNGAVKK